MGFVGIYRALYDYTPQGENELAIVEGDLLYVIERSGEDDWWKAKKKASGDEEEEPVGLIPNNYVEEAHPTQHARALYDYTRQTDEELSFSEDSQLEVFDTSDPDWILVGQDGEYGFAPSNYIDITEDGPVRQARPTTENTRSQTRDSMSEEHTISPESPQSQDRNPAAALAGIMMNKKASTSASNAPVVTRPSQPQYTPEGSDQEEQSTPSLPARSGSKVASPHSADASSPHSSGIAASLPHNRVSHRNTYDEDIINTSPGGFHLYNINEMVSVMGKRKKMPTTLGINLATGTIMISPEKARDGPSQEWTAEKMTHYSIEGKHVFLELIRPSKSVDFHAGSKDTAEEIVASLGDMAGAVKAEGLREVIMAGSGQGQKRGVILYDFMAQGDDEVTVDVNDEVIILDDTKSEEWWQVRRVKNGKEGVVPSSYIEASSATSGSNSSRVNTGRSTVEQNRLEEQRITKKAVKDASRPEVGPGMRLPERGSSLSARDTHDQQRSKRDNNLSDSGQHRTAKSKPDPSKLRTWNDRTKSFSVEAQFLALKDGKINLHKMNGVKIAVPVAKMSIEDLEYIEGITGVSLDEDKPLSNIKQQQNKKSNSGASIPKVGATIEHHKKPEYDWFQFFLSCDVTPGLCERYAQTFSKDSMDESVLPDVDTSVLRMLGLREGDIIKVMRHLDNKYGRKRNAIQAGSEPAEGDADTGSTNSLFSGPGGALRNNTRKGRPAPAIQTSDIVDPKTFSQSGSASAKPVPERIHSPDPAIPVPLPKDTLTGFDDDAWDVKPTKQEVQSAKSSSPKPSSTSQQTQPTPQTISESMQDLTLLTQPLEPTKAQPQTAQKPSQPMQQSQQQQSQPPQSQSQSQPQQPLGATPSFFTGVNQQTSGLQSQPMSGSFIQSPQFVPPQLGYGQQQSLQLNTGRQRPMAPQFVQSQGALMPPPPPRPLSAPHTTQQNAFGPPPIQPQMTGVPNSAFQSASLAPPGQSLAEINQMKIQQQYAQQQQQMQQQMAGFPGQSVNMMPQATGIPQFPAGQQQNGFSQSIQPQQSGFPPGQSMAGGPVPGPGAQQFSTVQPLSTLYLGNPNATQQLPQQYPQSTNINNFLSPPLQPQKTAQPSGINGFGQGFPTPQAPPIPQTAAPLIPQKTGPPPPVRFGIQGDTKKLTPQATGRRANLAQATPQNPFGF